ncbi:MAG: hypothetical protein VXU46_01530, partial [Planctomycetota bacterium]|nr:hypothetical protein [Planctomycetota bacterium]
MAPCVSDNLTDQVQHMAAQNLHAQLNELTRLVPTFDRSKGPASEPLQNQKLSPNCLHGLQIASKRGLQLLMDDYIVCLADLTKDAARAHVDTYAEDVDLDHRYEKLPVSPLLRAYFSRSQEGLPPALQQCLKETEESKPRKLAVMQWLLDPAVQEALQLHVRRCGELVENRSAGDGAMDMVPHDMYLGASHLHLKLLMRRKKITGKTNTAYGVRSDLLFTFALAAWLELTERWFAMPEDPLHNLPCVSNLNSLQIRSLGCNVHAEYALSSIPMFDHCCATCGRLLSPGISADHSAADVGKPGPACQIRGQHTTWDALPLCLLLWSKWTLSRTLLRGVANYDENTNQLRLAGGARTAPWLHYRKGTDPKHPLLPQKTRANVLYVVDHDKPWWYCQWCYRYWIDGGCERMPMRNRLEALYTTWHRDIAYPLLRPRLIQVYPANISKILRNQLPEISAAKEWRDKYTRRVELLRLPVDQQSTVTQQEVDNLTDWMHAKDVEWAPPPHLRDDATPVPLRYFLDAGKAKTGESKWSLLRQHNVDLVPCEQPDLLQDAPLCPDHALDDIQSAEARA